MQKFMNKSKWLKKGLLVEPNKKNAWMSHYVGPSFLRALKNNRFQLLLTGRDQFGVSRIGEALGYFKNGDLIIDKISTNPIFEIGEPGCFDENGVSYPWLASSDGGLFMYYVGWVSGGKTRFQNYTGLAFSQNGMGAFKRVLPVPILDRTPIEPFGSGSCSVIQDGNKFLMLYTSFYGWKISNKDTRDFDPCYDIKLAYSIDGISWERKNEVAIPHLGDETIVGKPSILRNIDGTYCVYFSARGEHYRIYRATGPSLDKLSREPGPELDVSDLGWDSEMVEYSHVVEHGAYRYMIYNGNNFGKTGLGYAVQKIT
jgi:hypothetical protein